MRLRLTGVDQRQKALPWPYVRAWRCPVFLGLGFSQRPIGRHWGFFGVVFRCHHMATYPGSLVCGLRTVRRGHFVQSQLFSCCSPSFFLWVTTSRRGRGHFAQSQPLKKSLLPLQPSWGPFTPTCGQGGPPLTDLNYVADPPSWILRTKAGFGLDKAEQLLL